MPCPLRSSSSFAALLDPINKEVTKLSLLGWCRGSGLAWRSIQPTAAPVLSDLSAAGRAAVAPQSAVMPLSSTQHLTATCVVMFTSALGAGYLPTLIKVSSLSPMACLSPLSCLSMYRIQNTYVWSGRSFREKSKAMRHILPVRYDAYLVSGIDWLSCIRAWCFT